MAWHTLASGPVRPTRLRTRTQSPTPMLAPVRPRRRFTGLPPVACTQPRPASSELALSVCTGASWCPSNGDGGHCADTTCTSGANGRCECFRVPTACGSGPICTYDDCASDADCGAGWAFLCRETVLPAGLGAMASLTRRTVCVAASCRVDSDCGVGGYCSPSPSPSCNEWFTSNTVATRPPTSASPTAIVRARIATAPTTARPVTGRACPPPNASTPEANLVRPEMLRNVSRWCLAALLPIASIPSWSGCGGHRVAASGMTGDSGSASGSGPSSGSGSSGGSGSGGPCLSGVGSTAEDAGTPVAAVSAVGGTCPDGYVEACAPLCCPMGFGCCGDGKWCVTDYRACPSIPGSGGGSDAGIGTVCPSASWELSCPGFNALLITPPDSLYDGDVRASGFIGDFPSSGYGGWLPDSGTCTWTQSAYCPGSVDIPGTVDFLAGTATFNFYCGCTVPCALFRL